MNAPLAAQRYFDDVAVGDDFEQWQCPTRERVMAFMNVTGMFDPDPRITDTGTARAAGLAGPVVPSALTFNMIARMVTDWIGPFGRIISLDVMYRRPVLHDDLVRCVASVMDVNGGGDYEGTDEGAVYLELLLENERREKAVQGTAVVVIPRRG